MDKRNPSTTLGNTKPPIAAQLLDKEQHSIYRTAVGQLLWVSQLRVGISFAVKELSRALQQPDDEDLKTLKQLLRCIKGTTHYKVTLAPKKVERMNKDKPKSTLTLAQTATGQVAIPPGRAQVEQSHHAGVHLYYTLAEHNPQVHHLQKLN
eukprot:6491609-Amphidinium_carterae.4